jgi:hypothetical protein
MGFARVGPDEPMREDELDVVPLVAHGLSSGVLEPVRIPWVAGYQVKSRSQTRA